MKFRITRHSGSASPPDALDLLAEQLGPRRDGLSFSKASSEITATWREDESLSRTQEERAAIGRLAVLDAVCSACEPETGLKADWFAVSLQR